MYCTSCGKQIADDAVSCRYCGNLTLQGDELAKLVAAVRVNDQNAISTLYEKTYSKVYYTVKSMIKDEDTVLDIVQDTYIKAFAHLDSFQGDTKFLPWVRQIAANTARDWLKKKRPMLFTELSSGDEQDTPVEELFPDECSDNLPDQVIDQEETKRLLREIIEELPEDQRAVIGMRYYEEMSVKEIAAAMGVSESAVKSRLMYGRNKIEKKVRELEKQGTKLYSLSPIPFLLLLFRNQETYAAEMPDERLLHAILTSQPMDAATAIETAQGAGTVGAAAGTEAAGSATAGTAAAVGGLGALKIGLIVLAVVAVVGLGTFGATQAASRSAEPQKLSTIEDVIDQEETEDASEIIAEDEAVTEDETEVLAENTNDVTTSTSGTPASSQKTDTSAASEPASTGSQDTSAQDTPVTSEPAQTASAAPEPAQTTPAASEPAQTASATSEPAQTTPAHEHVWKERLYQTQGEWNPNVVTINEYEDRCSCGFTTTEPGVIEKHFETHKDENGVYHESWTFVWIGSHEEDLGHYTYYGHLERYCDCGAVEIIY